MLKWGFRLNIFSATTSLNPVITAFTIVRAETLRMTPIIAIRVIIPGKSLPFGRYNVS